MVYRPDEKWGYVADGSACLYLKDVTALIQHDCKLLHEIAIMFPDFKWFVIGGSPCQDLTFAGHFQGLIGLVGSNSRFFFVLLCVIHNMRTLVGVAFVRFLVENAGSMHKIHYRAFCQLLGLPAAPSTRYQWDLVTHGYPITRKRNFFRRYDDSGPVAQPLEIFGDNYGPLITPSGKTIPLAHVLRVRTLSRTECLVHHGPFISRRL